MEIDHTKLSIRASNILKKRGITTLEQLKEALRNNSINYVRNAGGKTINELRNYAGVYESKKQRKMGNSGSITITKAVHVSAWLHRNLNETMEQLEMYDKKEDKYGLTQGELTERDDLMTELNIINALVESFEFHHKLNLFKGE